MAVASRPSFGRALLASSAAVGTTWVALTSWSPFVTTPGDFVNPLLTVAVVLALSGAALRSAGAPRAVALLVQAVVGTIAASQVVTGSPLAIGTGGAGLIDAVRVGVESARTYAAPIGSAAPPVWPLLVVGGTVFLVLVDAVACTFARAAASGLALLAVYAVPSGLSAGGSGVVGFAVAALGFAAMLHLEQVERSRRWGRRLGPDNDGGLAGLGAGRIAVGATALALLTPVLLPGAGIRLFDTGPGTGDGDIRIRRPVADMKRDLERGADVPLVSIATDDPDPSYLRISVLNRFTGETWSSGDRDVANEDRADGPLPPPPGLDPQVPRESYTYRVRATRAFDSNWLPSTYPAASVEAVGDWRFDPSTLDFLAADDDLDTRGISYSLTSLRPDYGTDGRYFNDSSDTATSTEVRDLPAVPAIVGDLARRVTARAEDDYDRALLLQRWFREDGGFRYDLASAPDGMGNDTLAGFLAPSGRVGYCEQFASAMAVMARSLGIPARVAVGFLRPTRQADGTWLYSSHDLHAWPELYFSGAGWVRFEPTPAGRAGDVPSYTTAPLRRAQDPTADPSTGASAAPSASASAAPSAGPLEEQQSDDPTASSGSGPGRTALAVAGGVLLAVALAAAALLGPRSVRAARRRTRSNGDPGEAWRELEATAVDLGLPWKPGRSPRQSGEVLLHHLGDPDAAPTPRPRTGPDEAPEAAGALERLLRAVERDRYGRRADSAPPAGTSAAGSTRAAVLDDTATVAADLALVLRSLEAGAPLPQRRRAAWWPASLWRRP